MDSPQSPPPRPNPICPPSLEENVLSALFNEITDAVFAIDFSTGCIAYWNNGAQRTFGYPANQAIGRTTEFLHPGDETSKRGFEVIEPDLKRFGFWRGEWKFQRRDGTLFPAELTATIMIKAPTPNSHAPNHVLVVVRDISARKEKEMDLQTQRLNNALARHVSETTSELNSVRKDLTDHTVESRLTAEQFGLLIQGVRNVAILTLDVDGSITSWNSGAERIFTCDEKDVMGIPFARFYRDYEASKLQIKDILNKSSSTGSHEERAQLVRNDGTIIHADIFIAPFYDSVGTLFCYLVIVRDITDRVILRQKLQEKEQLATVGTTAAMFAHEVSNPLNGMSTTIQLLERTVRNSVSLDRDSLTSSLDDLKNEISRLQHLLSEFKSLARPSTLNLDIVDLAELIRDTVKLSIPHEASRGTRLVAEFAPNLPPVTGDAAKLKQALLNLIKNALEATHGEGTVTVKAYPAGSNICIQVIDTGDGVSNDVNIFELFATTKSGGTGLGLVIVKQIISAHGGSITYTSTPDDGTSFLITLPTSAPGRTS